MRTHKHSLSLRRRQSISEVLPPPHPPPPPPPPPPTTAATLHPPWGRKREQTCKTRRARDRRPPPPRHKAPPHPRPPQRSARPLPVNKPTVASNAYARSWSRRRSPSQSATEAPMRRKPRVRWATASWPPKEKKRAGSIWPLFQGRRGGGCDRTTPRMHQVTPATTSAPRRGV